MPKVTPTLIVLNSKLPFAAQVTCEMCNLTYQFTEESVMELANF